MATPHCKHCGTEVIWLPRADGPGTHPPLVKAGLAYVLDEHHKVQQTQVFVRHWCDPDRRRAWQADQAAREQEARDAQTRTERAERQAEREQQDWLDYVAMREETYRLAARADCPKCQAKEGEECLNLNIGKRKTPKGQSKYTRWPHPERVLAAAAEKDDED